LCSDRCIVIFKSKVIRYDTRYLANFCILAEKRQADEPLSSATEEPRKKKIDGDVPSDVVAEVLEVTSDPKKMLGPDVSVLLIFMPSHFWLFCRKEYAIYFTCSHMAS